MGLGLASWILGPPLHNYVSAISSHSSLASCPAPAAFYCPWSRLQVLLNSPPSCVKGPAPAQVGSAPGSSISPLLF